MTAEQRSTPYRRPVYRRSALLATPNSYKRLILYITEIRSNGLPVPCTMDSSDSEWWFIEEKRIEEKAKILCMSCPAMVECGRHALENDEVGIWGAMTRSERLAMRSKLLARGTGPEGY